MRSVIIDNSTLTATQRLLGRIEIFNTLSIDGDIAAFENLIQAILFYDTILYVDDYKEEFRSERKEFFKYFSPIDTNEFAYQTYIDAASDAVADTILKVSGGKIDSNEFGKFLELLKMHTTFTWDMQTSKYFLTLKMLSSSGGISQDKYSKLMQAIFTELSANSESIAKDKNRRFAELIGSNGAIIKKKNSNGEDQVRNQIYGFASSLNWLSLRTAFYSLISTRYEADAVLHPIRSAFQLSFANKLGIENRIYQPLLKRLTEETQSIVVDIKNNTDPIILDFDFPIFSAWLARKGKRPSEMIETAFDMRTSKLFSEARRELINLEQLLLLSDTKSFVTEVNRIMLGIRKIANQIREEYSIQTKNGFSISPYIAVFNAVLNLKGLPNLPNLPIKIKLPNAVLNLAGRNGFRGLFKSITHDLVAVERLGELHEKLSTDTVLHKNADDFLVKTEDIKFFGKESSWKKPM